MIYFIIFIICCVTLDGYIDAAAGSSIIWQISLVLVALVAIFSIVVHVVKCKFNKSIDRFRYEAIGIYNKQKQAVQDKIDVYEKQLNRLNKYPGYLTPDELSGIFKSKPDLDKITDKEIDDLLIWLSYYYPSKDECEKCWLYEHYKTYAHSSEGIWEDWCKTRDQYYVGVASSLIGFGTTEMEKIIHNCNGSWKNTLLRIIVCNCIEKYIYVLVAIPGTNYDLESYRKCKEIQEKEKATNEEQAKYISLFSNSSFSRDVLGHASWFRYK